MFVRVFIGEALAVLHVHRRWVLLAMLFGLFVALSTAVIPVAWKIGDNSISRTTTDTDGGYAAPESHSQ